MIDNVRLGPPEPDSMNKDTSLVTLDVVGRRFEAAGLPRSIRTLQRYCANGTLECVKEATDTGDAYFVVETSIQSAITSLRQLHDAKNQLRHSAVERDMSGDVIPAVEPQNAPDHVGLSPTETDNDAKETSERQGASQFDMASYVAQLELRIKEKDKQIAFLQDEMIDRREHLHNMKKIIDGQNNLLDTIQRNVAPVFQALASTVDRRQIKVTSLEQGSAHDVRKADDQARADENL